MNKPTKEFILWVHNGNGQYVPYFFDTEKEAILYEKMTEDWYITRGYTDIGSMYLTYREPPQPPNPKDL